MKFLFLYILPPSNVCYTKYNSGIASLSAVLKQKGHQTELFLVDKFDREKLNISIEKFQPDIIGYSFVSQQKELAHEIIGYIANSHKIPSIIGGVHATVAPEECLSIEGVLGVCVGEAELALTNFLDAYTEEHDFYKTPNFYFKQNGKIVRNPLFPLIQDLDALPFPDRKLFCYNPAEAMLGLEFFFSRGCPYQCSYCINWHLQKLYKGKGPYVRFRSPESVIKEIQETVALYNYQGMLTFHDDVFTLKESWLRQFAILYHNNVGLPYRCNSTAGKIDEEVAQYLKDSHCQEVWFGIETGFEELRSTVLNKRTLDEDIFRAGRILNEFGISPCSFNMLGIPGESEDNINRLIEINIKAGVKKVDVGIIQPYPGTAIYEQGKKNDTLIEHNAPSATMKGIKNLNISDSLLYKYFYLFNHYIFGGKFFHLLDFLLKFTFFQWVKRKAQLLPPKVKNYILLHFLRGY